MKKYQIEKTVIESVDYTEYIAHKLKYHREKSGMSQTDLAKHIGVSRGHIGGMEIGKNIVTIETLHRLCVVLKIKSSDILPF